jgi:uncharacterized membrane protein
MEVRGCGVVEQYPNFYSDQKQNRQTESSVNIDLGQRRASLLGGSLLLAAALAKRGWVGLGLGALGSTLLYQGSTGVSPINRLLGINQAVHDQDAAISVPHQQGKHIRDSITIKRPAQDLYSFWRDFTNLTQVLPILKSVEVQDATHSHWTINGPAGMNIEWDTEIINEDPGNVIGWRSLENPYINHAGSVRFREAPKNQGTEVLLEMEYLPVGGAVSVALMNLLGKSPEQQISTGLYRLKQMMELGEIATTEGQSSGREKVEG